MTGNSSHLGIKITLLSSINFGYKQILAFHEYKSILAFRLMAISVVNLNNFKTLQHFTFLSKNARSKNMR
jgi:hypothetical protein